MQVKLEREVGVLSLDLKPHFVTGKITFSATRLIFLIKLIILLYMHINSLLLDILNYLGKTIYSITVQYRHQLKYGTLSLLPKLSC